MVENASGAQQRSLMNELGLSEAEIAQRKAFLNFGDIVSGLSPEVAHALVRIGIDLTMVTTVGTLQDGIEAAEQLLGYTVTKNGTMPHARHENGES